MDELRKLKALERRATAEEIEEAEFDAAIAEHEAWEAAGRPAGREIARGVHGRPGLTIRRGRRARS